MSVFSITLVLFLLMDPVGHVSSVLKMMKGIPLRRQSLIIIREMLIAFAAMLLFNFAGEFFFSWLQLSETTIKLSSGLILFLIALQILFPKTNSIRENIPEEEPFVVPLAIPLIAGPAVLATIMLYAHMEGSYLVMLLAISLACVAATVVLLLSHVLVRALGVNGLMACEKLMGMILVLLAVQRFLDGVAQFMSSY